MDEQHYFGYSKEEYLRFRRYAWRYLIAFSLLYCTLYCVRLNLSAAAPAMMRELGLTKAQIGILTSTLFWTYGIGQLINGRLSDYIGPEKFIIISTIVSTTASIVMGFQSNFHIMLLVWAINGFAQSMAWASGIAIITRWWPGKTRGFATGFAYAFSGFGQVLMTLSVTFAIANFSRLGWRAAFIIPAFFPAFMFLIYLLFAKTKPQHIGLKEYVEENDGERSLEEEMKKIVRDKGALYPYKYVLSDRHYRAWVVIIFMAGIARYGLSTWIPLYFIDNYGIDITSGLIQSLALPLGMGIGTLVVPTLTDKYCPNNRLVAVVFSAALAAIVIFSFSLLNPVITWQLVVIELLLFLSGFCIYAISGTSGAYATDIGGRVLSGTATGILSFSAYMGAAIQSLVYGFALDNMGWRFVFISISVLCLLIVGISLTDTQNN